MEIEIAQIGLALASYVAGIISNWWWENRKKVLGTIEETLEDKVEELSALKVAELRERLEAVGLPVNGKKAILITRLAEHLSDE